MKLKSRFRIPRFNIRQLLLLTLLLGIVLAMTANARRQQPAQAFHVIAFSPDGNRIAIGGDQNTQIIDLKNKSMIATIPIGLSNYMGRQIICFRDNDTIAAWSRGSWGRVAKSGIYLYSIPDKSLTFLQTIGPWGDSIAICPEGYANRDATGSILSFYRFDSNEKVSSTAVRKSDDRIWLDKSGQSVTLFSGFHQSRGPFAMGPTPSTDLVNLETQSVENFVGTHSSAVLSPDSSQVFLSGRTDSQLVDRKTQEAIWTFDKGQDAENCQFSEDGKMVALMSKIENMNGNSLERQQAISVLDSATGQEILNIDVNDRLQSSFAFSPDGKTLAVGDSAEYFGGVQLWDIKSGELVARIGTGYRLTLLILFPALMVIWAIGWIMFQRGSSEPVDSIESIGVSAKTTARRKFIVAILSTMAGVLVVIWFSTICNFSMGDSGLFGQLPALNQAWAIVVMSSACLGGVWLMVFGGKRLVAKRTSQNP